MLKTGPKAPLYHVLFPIHWFCLRSPWERTATPSSAGAIQQLNIYRSGPRLSNSLPEIQSLEYIDIDDLAAGFESPFL